ncbi:calcium-activated chloride channel regulator 1-like [Ptychodera flava]|uniref:calcium-activated chloride channel regulator 1-like n=1 Tax=Ptychodera flava TaxID=63121 RepID=UPI00396A3286
MVLSVGASMASADRIQKMGQALRSFIMDDVQDGERVGMVTFNDKGNMMSDMVAMNDSMRDTMLPDIPTPDDVGGSSNLEAGVMKGIEVLERDGRNPSGGVILLVTDGQENENDKMDEMMPMLKDKNVTVDFIAIGGNASKNLETIAESTNGMSFSYSEEYSSSNGLNEAFDTISQRGQNVLTLPVTVYSKALHVESKGSEEFTFNIDSTIGEGTQLTFDCLGGNDTAEVTVRKPDGGEIKKDSEGYQIDSRFHVVTIKIPGVAQIGRYDVTIYNPLSNAQTVMVTVKSGGKLQDDYPIIALAEWSQSKMTPPDQIVLHVAVTRGYSPVLNAMVQAKIERPGGVAMDITLLDNGAGADMAKDDGIYSMYFTSYTGAGRYTAKIFVVNDGDKTVVSLSKRTGYGAINVPNSENEDNIELPADESTGVFQRSANSGSLMCEGDDCQMSQDTDMYSPSRITDLSVHDVSFEKKQVTLQFTAPGDDMDQGQASRYEIRMGVNFTDMMEDMSAMMMVTQDMVVQGDLSQPKPAGSTELITIQTVPEYDDAVLVFSMIAVDDSDKKSPQSNIVTAAFVDQVTASSAAPSVNTVIMVATAILWLTM